MTEEMREQAEYQQVIKDIQMILGTKQGRNFIRYLYVNLNVATLPDTGLPERLLMEALGFHKAGQDIFDLITKASPSESARILAQIKGDKNEELLSANE